VAKRGTPRFIRQGLARRRRRAAALRPREVHTVAVKRALFCCALVIVARASFALDPARAISQYGHTAWRVRDGHFPGAVNSIAQTRDGYLRVGTEGGLLRYDGVRFELWVPPGAVESLGASRPGQG